MILGTHQAALRKIYQKKTAPVEAVKQMNKLTKNKYQA